MATDEELPETTDEGSTDSGDADEARTGYIQVSPDPDKPREDETGKADHRSVTDKLGSLLKPE